MASRPPGSGSKASGARTSQSTQPGLTVAVTGPTGTFGFGLMPLLEANDRIEKVVGVARRPFDPAAHHWTKMAYRRGDVQDPGALAEAFDGADVVVHLAFMITGSASRRRSVPLTSTAPSTLFERRPPPAPSASSTPPRWRPTGFTTTTRRR